MSIFKSRTVQRLLLVVASGAFAWFCLELPALLGVLDYRTIIGPFHAWWAPNISDPELGIIHRPHAHQSGSAVGGDASSSYQIPPSDLTRFRWDVTYDRNGFRNSSDLEGADVVVIGDSFVEGLTVSNTELVTSRLALLQGAVVANLGQSTYGPLQELIVLKRYGLPLHPKTVVWLFSEASDLDDVVQYHRAMSNRPTFWHAFWTRSFTRSAYLAAKRMVAPPVKPLGAKRSGLCQTLDGMPQSTYFMFRSRALSQQDLSALDETVQTIDTAYKLCAAQGARLIFVFVPTKFRVLHDLCRFSETSDCRTWVLSDLSERLRSALAGVSPNIGYVDLTPYLVNAAKTEQLPYYRDDEHWSPEGHKVAASVINQYLASTAN
jgi:hypothetical protein